MNEPGRFAARGLGLVLGACLLAAPRTASAQTGAMTFSKIETLLPAGTTVVVETVDGRTIKGRLRRLSDSGLVFDKAGAPAIPPESIRTISRRIGRRPVLKGPAAGLAAGTGIGLTLLAEASRDQHTCAPRVPVCRADDGMSAGATAGVITVLGAGIGAGIGALITPPMAVIYRAPSPSRVTIAPVVTSRRRGIALSVVF